MKQFHNPSFEEACAEALKKARSLNDLPRITEAVRRAALLIAMKPEDAENVFREKLAEGKKI